MIDGKLISKVDVEVTFAEVVRDYGGVVVDDKLPKSPTFQNADYVFHFEKVVAELKCLKEDNISSPSNEAKVTELVRDWFNRGRIKTTKIDSSNWRDLPKELQSKIYEIKTRSIRRRVEKANAQIRETKEALGLSDYAGLLIIANDGVSSLPPAAFIHATQLALSRHYSEIRHFVFLTANLYTTVRDNPSPVLFWISFDMQDGLPIETVFLDRLGKSWRWHHARKVGIPTWETELQDIEGFWNARNIK